MFNANRKLRHLDVTAMLGHELVMTATGEKMKRRPGFVKALLANV